MNLLFPIVAFSFLFILFETIGEWRDWRRSFLMAALVWSIFLVVTIEALSLFTQLSVRPMVFLWVTFDFALLVYLYGRRQRVASWRPPSCAGLGWDEWLMLVGGALLVAVTLVVALWAPPNSWDAMTYHIPRVMQWIQNQTVAFYPTHNIRQLYLSPFAEYVILGFQLLTGGDRFANIPQFFSWAATPVAVSLIARSLGAERKGQIIAALFALTVPTGILEASGTKNDCVLSFWLATFVWFGLLWKEKMDDTPRAALAGLALGFALFTKGTAYVLVFPFIVWFGIAGVATLGKNVWRPVIIVALFAVTLNAPLYVRNIAIFDHPLGTMAEEYPQFKPTNDIFTPAAFASNAIRGAALHLGSPSSNINQATYNAINWIHKSILKIDINHPGTTWVFDFSVPIQSPFRQYELIGAANIHFLFIIPTLLFALSLTFWQKKSSKLFLFYIISAASSLFLIILLFRWTPQNTRYHLPLFILAAPVAGYLMSIALSRGIVTAIIAVILLAQAMPPALMNRTRPILPVEGFLLQVLRGEAPDFVINGYKKVLLGNIERDEALFSGQPFITESYREATDFLIKGECREIGFIADLDNDPTGQRAMEYQLIALLKNSSSTPLKWRHVNVINQSNILAPPDPFIPCALIRLHVRVDYFADKPYTPPEKTPDVINVDGKEYQRAMLLKYIAVFLPIT